MTGKTGSMRRKVNMPSVRPTAPLTVVAYAVVGLAVGLLMQVARSSRGFAPFVPPYSLALTLAVLAAGVLTLGFVLRRMVTRDTGGNVNPQTAIVILSAARASQFVGSLLGGFAAGLALSLLSRTVPAPTETWLPMLAALGAGLLLLVCGAVAEYLCRIPPDDEEPESDGARGPDVLDAPA